MIRWADRRKHHRIVFREPGRPNVHLVTEPPLYHPPVHVPISELSAGGLSIRLDEALPRHTKCILTFELPPLGKLTVYATVRTLSLQKRPYLIGFSFQGLESATGKKIGDMANDWDACEQRIAKKERKICIGDICRFYEPCQKPQKE